MKGGIEIHLTSDVSEDLWYHYLVVEKVRDCKRAAQKFDIERFIL
jgi:hypothetical protein